MAVSQKMKDNLIPVKKGEKSRNPNGRPKKVETILKEIFLSEYNVKLSKCQATDIMKVILTKTKSEIIALAKDDNLPFWISMIVNKASKDFKKGSIEILEKIFNMAYDNSKETLEVTIKGKNDITEEDKALIEKQIEKRAKALNDERKESS